MFYDVSVKINDLFLAYIYHDWEYQAPLPNYLYAVTCVQVVDGTLESNAFSNRPAPNISSIPHL